MAEKKRLIKVEGTNNRAETAAFLHTLAEQIAAGKLVLGEGKKEQTLGVADELTLEIQAEAKKKKGKRTRYNLEIEIQFSEAKAGKQEEPESEDEENEGAESEASVKASEEAPPAP